MSEVIHMLFNGTNVLFNPDNKSIEQHKSLDAKKELRIIKKHINKSVLERSGKRVRKIVDEALS